MPTIMRGDEDYDDRDDQDDLDDPTRFWNPSDDYEDDWSPEDEDPDDYPEDDPDRRHRLVVQDVVRTSKKVEVLLHGKVGQ